MFKYIEQNWKKLLIIILIVTAAVVVFAFWRKNQVLANSTETTLGNPARNAEGYNDTFYYDQLSEREKVAYEMLETAFNDFKGGEVVFPQALTGREYTRVIHALEYGASDYYYGVIGIPMTVDNKSVTYTNPDDNAYQSVLEITDESIAKCMLFLSCAEDVDREGAFDENGYVTNLAEMEVPLSNVVDEKVKTIQNEQQEIDAILDQIIAEMPAEYGAKEATDYFITWMQEHLNSNQENVSIDTMTGLFEQIYKKNGLSCVLEGSALPSAYVKVLSELCNRAGIRSHVVLGQWRDGKAYVMTCIEIDGQDIYVDASEGQKKDLWGQKYLNKQETFNVMNLVDYFNYD